MSDALGSLSFFTALDIEQVEAYFQPADKIPMSTGAPKFPVPASVKRAIEGRVRTLELLTYPPVEGEQVLRDAVARFHRQHLDLPHQAGNVLITYGAMQALYDVIATEVGAGQEVLIPAPFWFQFPHLVTQTGATPKLIATSAEEAFKLTPALLRASITPSTRLLLFTNPNNPTGTIYSRQELAALVEVLLEPANRHLQVISDEVYNLLLIDGSGRLPAAPSLGSFPAVAERVITVNSMSKNQAMSGLRVGYIAAHDVARFASRQRFSTLGVNAYLQAGATAAMAHIEPIVGTILDRLRERRRTALPLLRTVPGFRFETPQAGYYVWVSIGEWIGCRVPGGPVIKSDVELADFLDQDARVAVVKGTPCGIPDYFRITFAIDPGQFAEGVRRIRRSLDKLICPPGTARQASAPS